MKIVAQINETNEVSKIVILADHKDVEWLAEVNGGLWIEVTEGRKNNPKVGFTYDSDLDAFIPPKPFNSWVLDKETAQWEAPVEYPTDGKNYVWNEEAISWDVVPESNA